MKANANQNTGAQLCFLEGTAIVLKRSPMCSLFQHNGQAPFATLLLTSAHAYIGPQTMNLIAFVSDEHYLALPDVAADFESLSDGACYLLRSSARGAFYGDLPPGNYRITLAKAGFGAKRVDCTIGAHAPHQFRLLSDSLLGFMWPKWVSANEAAEIRVHSPEPYQLTLWRYGLRKEFVRMLGWFDEHGPRATVQITPDGDYSQTGVNWNHCGYPVAHVQQFVR